MRTDKPARQAMFTGPITMNEYVFAKAAPVLLETLVLLIDRHPEIEAEIQLMMITARANVSDQLNRSQGRTKISGIMAEEDACLNKKQINDFNAHNQVGKRQSLA